jgi:hypothetical protein
VSRHNVWTDKDTNDMFAVLEEINDGLNFSHNQLYISAERKI